MSFRDTQAPSFDNEKRRYWGVAPSISFFLSRVCFLLSGEDLKILLILLCRARSGKYLGTKEHPVRLSTFQLMYYTQASKSSVNKSLAKLKKLQLVNWTMSDLDGLVKTRLFVLNTDKIYSFVQGVDDEDFLSSRECRDKLGISNETALRNNLHKEQKDEDENKEDQPSSNEEIKKKYADIGDF